MRYQNYSSWFRRIEGVLLFALCFLVAASIPASAGVIYEFNLPANGAVGAIDLQLTLPDFLALTPTSPFAPTYYHLDDVSVTGLSSGTTINPAASQVGFVVTSTETWVGLLLVDPVGSVLALNLMTPTDTTSPGDFFVFSRTPSTVGAFSSTAGQLSDGSFSSVTTPTATLTVSNADTAIPEPATASLLGLTLLSLAGWKVGRRSA